MHLIETVKYVVGVLIFCGKKNTFARVGFATPMLFQECLPVA